MLITNHVLAGALLGAAAPGAVSAFTLGVASHVVMDAVPHWGDADLDRAGFLRVAVPDGLVGLATLAWIARRTPPGRRARVVAGMLGACALDADKPGELFLGRSPFPEAVDRWHGAIQRESPRRMSQEVLTAALSFLLVRRWLRGPGAP